MFVEDARVGLYHQEVWPYKIRNTSKIAVQAGAAGRHTIDHAHLNLEPLNLSWEKNPERITRNTPFSTAFARAIHLIFIHFHPSWQGKSRWKWTNDVGNQTHVLERSGSPKDLTSRESSAFTIQQSVQVIFLPTYKLSVIFCLFAL